MQPFRKHTGFVVPLDRANIDTDQIIPKQFLKRVERTGFGQFAFYDWRFNPDGSANPGFILNKPRYKQASVLVASKNFGCGSSREHAPWALADYGFKVIIAPTFADIFYNNSLKNGLLLVKLSEAEVAELQRRGTEQKDYRLTIDLETQQVTDNQGFSARFEIDEFRRRCLLEGLDDIGLTLRYADQITAYEQRSTKLY
jgi:3-isopropylmalate/(R)-2-methylmalate dehydratase small subunit